MSNTNPCPWYMVFDTYEEAIACQPEFKSEYEATLLEAIERHQRLEQESWERSDTDGCVTQWCNSISAQEKQREIGLANAGYTVVRPALLDIATGKIVAACVHVELDRFAGYGTTYKWHVRRSNPMSRQYRGIEYVTDYKRDANYEKLGLRKVWVLAPGRMAARCPGDHTPEPRGLSGLASYSGKHAYIDYEASGLPL
jgi:hypothetical protein